jgi:membrane-bound serine protease (ClpP class)
VLFIVAIALLLFLPSPWNVYGFGIALVLFFGEAWAWNRSMRGRRKVVGAQALVGADASVLEACRPNGQVRVSGEIWAARCEAGADSGDTVRIVGLDGLTLVVERV